MDGGSKQSLQTEKQQAEPAEEAKHQQQSFERHLSECHQ
jgi:hypothetical protein